MTLPTTPPFEQVTARLDALIGQSADSDLLRLLLTGSPSRAATTDRTCYSLIRLISPHPPGARPH